VELLVVIAIIGILVALLLPAIQAARQAALKNSCRNNMKQLALACQNHNDTFKTFPSLWFSNLATGTGRKGSLDLAAGVQSYSWIVRLLPFIEEDTLYKSISAKSNKFTVASQGLLIPTPAVTAGENPGRIKLGQILCPSYSGETETTASANGTANQATNYVAIPATVSARLTAVTGTAPNQTYTTPPDGMIIADKLARGQSMARMADGTSKTIVLGESKEGTTQNGASTTFFRWYVPTETFACGWGRGMNATATATGGTPRFNGTAWVPLAVAGNPDSIGLNFGPSPTATTRFETTAPNGPRSYGLSSDHMGGIVIHGMGDGSVQELTDTGTDPKVFFAAITTRGGENVGPVGGN